MLKTLWNRVFGEEKQDDPIHVRHVFSTSVIAPASYIDRSAASAEEATRGKIRRLKTALQQEGIIVGIHGESKSGKTMFARKTLLDGGYGFVIAEGTEIESLDGFWRHIAQKLQLNIRKCISTIDQKQAISSAAAWMSSGFSIPPAKIQGGLKSSSELRTLEQVTVQSEVLESLRETCLNFLELANMAVIVDDFHAIKDDKLRIEILNNVKIPAGLKRGKYVFVSIPGDALFIGRVDEQLIGRSDVYEFPMWSDDDLREIARQGFRVLNIGFEERQIVQIGRNSFSNPINIQQICINICTNCGISSIADVMPGFSIPQESVKLALGDFAHGLGFFDEIIRQAEHRGGTAAAEPKYAVGRTALNVYQLVFVALCSPSATGADGILQKTIRDKIRRTLGNETWSIPNLEEVLKRLADSEIDIDFARRGPDPNAGKRPLFFDADKKKLYVTNPMLRVYLLWGYLPRLGLRVDEIMSGDKRDPVDDPSGRT
jgi:hypothetical protein